MLVVIAAGLHILVADQQRLRGCHFEEVHVATGLEQRILSVIETVAVRNQTSDGLTLLLTWIKLDATLGAILEFQFFDLFVLHLERDGVRERGIVRCAVELLADVASHALPEFWHLKLLLLVRRAYAIWVVGAATLPMLSSLTLCIAHFFELLHTWHHLQVVLHLYVATLEVLMPSFHPNLENTRYAHDGTDDCYNDWI